MCLKTNLTTWLSCPKFQNYFLLLLFQLEAQAYLRKLKMVLLEFTAGGNSIMAAG